MINFDGRHFQKDMILQSVRWYLAYSLSYRNLEEIMAERGFLVDHSTINRWVIHYAPKLEKEFHKTKKRPGDRWRMDASGTRRRISKLKVSGDTTIEPLINRVTPSIFY